MVKSSKIKPFLWFDDQAEDAAKLYTSIFPDSEIDYYWDKLASGGGKPVQCGWLKDRFGLSWQVVPQDIGKYFKDAKVAERVMKAIMPMVKIDVRKIEEVAQ